VLLYGHSGTGKTFLIDAICNHFQLNRFNYDEFRALESKSGLKRLNTSSNSLTKLFNDAIAK
jgi:chromosomal replication initiation ATPase DnaA